MAQAVISFRVDAGLKKRMEDTCKNMGLSMSAAFTLFATKVTREQRIPFEISADPFYSDEHMSMLEQRIDDIEHGRNISQHELIEVE
ncbi:type II toxin-antitoxin system RelB/DinJ family antitoxin [uncultured Phascolarctobacterium sp.]|uniref:type II toxin-antitoxin system RelB/DinJ family antitoxin n=1 Tax=Phascolarctobacterium sp. TaxID=2049039 RepID=UPI00262D7C80|nr:type II toxin-antitoxin system RelB/DinJ family antitoxin [uncultured Phascolarctobacterium sp.]